MDSITTQLLFSILRSAISSAKLSESEKAQITAEQLQEIIDLSKKHDVLHLLAWGLKQNSVQCENDDELKKSISLAVYRHAKINRQYEIICKALEDAEIPFIPLKGSVIRKYYPEPWMRTSCDIDILVHEHDAEKAVEILTESHGYSNKTVSPHDISVFSADKVHLELHYNLIEDGRINNSHEVMSSVWETAAVHNGYRYFYDMSDGMFYFYHIAHMAKHFEYGGCGIRPFIDLWFLDNMAGIDFSEREKLLKEGGLLNLSQTASRLSDVWFGDEKADEMSTLLENFILHGSMYGSAESIHKMRAVNGENKATSFIKFVFPSREALANIFPLLSKYPILLPFYHVKRWFKIFNKGKRNNMKRKIDMIGSLSKQEVESTAKLLEYLNLTK